MSASPHTHDDDHVHDHSHGPFVDTSITRSKAGVEAVSIGLVPGSALTVC